MCYYMLWLQVGRRRASVAVLPRPLVLPSPIVKTINITDDLVNIIPIIDHVYTYTSHATQKRANNFSTRYFNKYARPKIVSISGYVRIYTCVKIIPIHCPITEVGLSHYLWACYVGFFVFFPTICMVPTDLENQAKFFKSIPGLKKSMEFEKIVKNKGVSEQLKEVKKPTNITLKPCNNDK